MKKWLVIFWLLALSSYAQAQVYWVDNVNGNDSNSCNIGGAQTTSTSVPAGSPKQTITAATGCIGTGANAGAGKTVIVRNGSGVYSDNLDEGAGAGDWLPRGSGTSWANANVFTLRAENRGQVTIRRNGFLFRTCAGGRTGTNADYFTVIDGFKFDASLAFGGDSGISLGCADYAGNFITFQYNEVFNTQNANLLQMGRHAVAGMTPSQVDGNYSRILYNKFHGSAPGSTNNGWYAIYTTAYHQEIRGNEFYDFPSFGIHIEEASTALTDDYTIDGNYFHNYGLCNGNGPTNNGAPAIVFGAVGGQGTNIGSRVTNNIFNCGNAAIDTRGFPKIVISNNTVNDMRGPTAANFPGAVMVSNDTVAKNNIFSTLSGGIAALGGYTSFTYNAANESPNLCTASGSGCTIVNANPQFINAGSGNFHQTSSSSPGINQGVDMSSTIGCTAGPSGTCLDANIGIFASGTGTHRPQGGAWDMGAYEFVAPVTCPSVPPALVASYGFEGNGNDASGNGRTATLGSGWSYTASGHLGQGALSNGTDGITVADHDSLDPCAAFTYEGWINLPNTSGDYVFIVKNPDSKAALFASISGVCGSGAIAGGYFEGSSHAVCYSIPLSPGFKHIALTYDANLPSANLKLYLNGVSVNTANGADFLSATTGSLQFCSSGFGETCPSGTVIDEVRIYNYARSASEIASSVTTPPVYTIKLQVSSIKIGPSVSLKVGVP